MPRVHFWLVRSRILACQTTRLKSVFGEFFLPFWATFKRPFIFLGTIHLEFESFRERACQPKNCCHPTTIFDAIMTLLFLFDDCYQSLTIFLIFFELFFSEKVFSHLLRFVVATWSILVFVVLESPLFHTYSSVCFADFCFFLCFFSLKISILFHLLFFLEKYY